MKRKKCYLCGRKRYIKEFEYLDTLDKHAHSCLECNGKDELKTKKCISCKKTKPVTDFYKRRSESEGRKSSCKKCCAIYAKKRRGTNKDKTYQKEYQKEYRKTPKEERELKRKRQKMEANKAAHEAKANAVNVSDKIPDIFG